METARVADAAGVVAEVDGAFADLLAACAGLDDTAKTTVMQGTWTLTDILGHIAGWHQEMTPVLERVARGEKAVPAGTDYGDFDVWNARFVEARGGMSPAQVEADLAASFAAFRRALLAVPAARRGSERTAGRIAREAGYEHYRHHAAQIRGWRQRSGR